MKNKSVFWGFRIKQPYDREELKKMFGDSFEIGNKKKGISEESVFEIDVCGRVWFSVKGYENEEKKSKEVSQYVSKMVREQLKTHGSQVMYSGLLMTKFLSENDFAKENMITGVSFDRLIRAVRRRKGNVKSDAVKFDFDVTEFDTEELPGILMTHVNTKNDEKTRV